MRVAQVSRYPVKSMQGETLSGAEIELDGMLGDRRWGVRDELTGKILTARRAPELLFAAAAWRPDGVPTITLPSGVICEGPGDETDDALSDWLGKPVRLVSATGARTARAEFFADATDDASEAIEWTMPAGRFVDAQPLLVLTTASLRAAAARYPDGDWDVRRFRPNLVLEVDGDEWAEDSWFGEVTLRSAAVALVPREPCVRCTMVTRPQPGLDEDRNIFRTLARNRGATFGAWTAVADRGRVNVGDEIRTEQRSPELRR